VIGSTFQIRLDRKPIGEAVLVAKRTFAFKKIREALSYLDIGMQPHVLAGAIKNWYKDELTFFGDEEMAHLVLKWELQHEEAFDEMLRVHWNTIIRRAKYIGYKPEDG